MNVICVLSFFKHKIVLPVLNIWYIVVGLLFGEYLLCNHGKPVIVYIAMIKLGGLNKHVNVLSNGIKYDSYVIMADGLVRKSMITFKMINYSLVDIIHIINPDIVHIHQIDDDLNKFEYITRVWSSIVTVHDLYYVCPRFFMVDKQGRFCHPNDDCSNKWRSDMLRILDNAKCVIFPNQSIYDIMVYYYKLLNNKSRVIEHGDILS